MESELENVVYMSGVYIKLLMNQGAESGLVMQVDTGFLEN